MRRAGLWEAAVLLVCLATVPAAWALPGNLIQNVPDWNQPVPVGYPSWCSPTAGGNLMGYWEDQKGKVGLTDRLVPPNVAGYANNAATYKQGLYQDGQIEMGYYMLTDGWGPPPNTKVPPGSIPPGTSLNKIGPGMAGYANGAWVDPGSGIVKVAYAITQGIDVARNAQMWINYLAEINASRPALCSFDLWVNVNLRLMPDWTLDSFPLLPLQRYGWDLTMSEGHTVVGVGYIDITPGFQNNGIDEFFICQDGWGNTGQYVVVPVDTYWQQNDYVYTVDLPGSVVPEPAGLAVLGLMLVGSLAVRRRRA